MNATLTESEDLLYHGFLGIGSPVLLGDDVLSAAADTFVPPGLWKTLAGSLKMRGFRNVGSDNPVSCLLISFFCRISGRRDCDLTYMRRAREPRASPS